MRNKKLIPMLANACNAVLFFVLIHYWMADWYSSSIDISPLTARWFLMTFAGLYFGVRGLRIALGKDAVTLKIDQWLEGKNGK